MPGEWVTITFNTSACHPPVGIAMFPTSRPSLSSPKTSNSYPPYRKGVSPAMGRSNAFYTKCLGCPLFKD